MILLIFLRPLANDAAATKWSMPRATKRRMGEEDEDDNNMIAYEVNNTAIAYICAEIMCAVLFTTPSCLQPGRQTFELSASAIS